MNLKALLFLSAVVSLASGCGDACYLGGVRCDGKLAQLCLSSDGSLAWSTMEECVVACRVLANAYPDGAGATCVDSTEPVDECANVGSACWRGAPTTCVDGYPTLTQPACGQSTPTCAVENGAAVCGAS